MASPSVSHWLLASQWPSALLDPCFDIATAPKIMPAARPATPTPPTTKPIVRRGDPVLGEAVSGFWGSGEGGGGSPLGGSAFGGATGGGTDGGAVPPSSEEGTVTVFVSPSGLASTVVFQGCFPSAVTTTVRVPGSTGMATPH